MPASIVPEAREIRAEAHRLFLQPQHPQEVEVLLRKVIGFARDAERIGQLWDQHQEAERQRWEADLTGWEAEYEAQEDGRLFLETRAAEHSFRDLLFE